MLNDLFQKSHGHHRSLPLLGPILDDFDDWLFEQGYRYSTRQCYMLRCTAIEKYFRRRKQCSLSVLTPEKLRECWRFYCRRPGGIAGTVGCLQRFLQSRQMLPAPIGPPASAFGAIVDAYRQYMREVHICPVDFRTKTFGYRGGGRRNSVSRRQPIDRWGFSQTC
jgi:integrase/recombinase XerD